MIQQKLLTWFASHRRDLPWRAIPRDPYAVLVSELMLQQTQVSRVLPKFEAFMKRYPTFGDLANAGQSDVVVLWAGLGYNRRAKYLWETARVVTKDFGGIFPSNPEDIEKLPGIGPYTARALRVFALGEETYMVDTNIRRIIGRAFIGIREVLVKELVEVAASVVPAGKADVWHQGLMDFGSAVCLSTPHCDVCPIARECKANREAREAGYKTYASYLLDHKPRKKGESLPFHSTNRYFRGRIIDYLRTGPASMHLLKAYVQTELGLTDHVRFGELIEGLMKERMITIEGSMVRLA